MRRGEHLDTTAADPDVCPFEAGPGESPGFLLWHATLRWQRGLAAALGPLELTHVQFVLLASVWWLAEMQGGRPTQREVADHAGTDRMMTSQVLRGLERRDLLVREQDSLDGRVRRLHVTEAGAALARRAVVVVEAADAELFGPVDDLPGLTRALRGLAGRAGEDS